MAYTRMKHDVEAIDRALTFHAKNSPMEYHGFENGEFVVSFLAHPERFGEPLRLSKREAHLVCFGLATGRRSTDLERVSA